MYCFSGKYFSCNVFVALQRKPSLLIFFVVVVVVYSKEITQKKKKDNYKQT